jgi:hypothetical protein
VLFIRRQHAFDTQAPQPAGHLPLDLVASAIAK